MSPLQPVGVYTFHSPSMNACLPQCLEALKSKATLEKGFCAVSTYKECHAVPMEGYHEAATTGQQLNQT